MTAAAGFLFMAMIAQVPQPARFNLQQSVIQIDLSPSLFGIPSLRQGGREVSAGIGGGALIDMVRGVPSARAEAEKYRTNQMLGFGMLAAGVALFVAGGLYWMAEEPEQMGTGHLTDGRSFKAYEDKEVPVAAPVLVVSGALVTIAGSVMSSIAAGNLSDAVNSFNQSLIQSWEASARQVPPPPPEKPLDEPSFQ